MGSVSSETTPPGAAAEIGAGKAPYRIVEEPSRIGRKLRVVCLGAGASAIQLAHDVSGSNLDIDLVCYDKNPSIGGTWYENRYPGCACDVPSVIYQFTWAPWPDWTSFYSGSAQILTYFKWIVEKHNLGHYFKTSHRVVGAYWDEEPKKWRVKIQRGDDPNDVFEDVADVFVNASGVLNKWKWPDIPGRESFQGQMLHSAAWDDKIDLTGKRVAVIGGGSSSVQIVPNIQPIVGEMKCFMRSAAWITAAIAGRFAGKEGRNFDYSERQKDIMSKDPVKYLAYRKKIEGEMNARFRFILNGSKEAQEARDMTEKDMRRKLASLPEVADLLVPKDFGVGCRRPTPGQGYLEALCADNVQVVSQTITEFTPTGIRTTARSKDGADGINATEDHEFDVIICATGFDVSWRPSYPTIGRGGRSLSEQWKEMPNTYLSVTIPNFPNYHVFNGPFGAYAHGSVLPVIEYQSSYLMKALRKMSEEAVTSFAPTEAATADFIQHRRQWLPRSAWSSPCSSWFKGGTKDGEIMMWPGSRIHYFETLGRGPRWEDYELTHTTSNRFGYLGNGFAAREFDGSDMSWYMGFLGDGGDVQVDLPDEDFADFLMN